MELIKGPTSFITAFLLGQKEWKGWEKEGSQQTRAMATFFQSWVLKDGHRKNPYLGTYLKANFQS